MRERFRLFVDGAEVAAGSSCFELGQEGWRRLEAGASAFAVWSVRKGRTVVSRKWRAGWPREAAQQ